MVDLERSFGFLVNDVARLFGRRFDHNGRRLGLTRAQCRTLGYLARNEGINQAGLAAGEIAGWPDGLASTGWPR